MDVSLDADITIHLYASEKEELLYKYFENCYIHEFVIEREIRNKSTRVYNKMIEEIENDKITKVTTQYLIDIGMKKQFEEKVYEYQSLFDFGETNAIALASVLGIAALATDDTKYQGPHDTLVRELIEDIIPFSFYELLYLEYLKSKDYKKMKEEYETINKVAYPKYPMDFISRIKRVVRRFSQAGSERDKNWMNEFCKKNNIDYRSMMKELKVNLQKEC